MIRRKGRDHEGSRTPEFRAAVTFAIGLGKSNRLKSPESSNSMYSDVVMKVNKDLEAVDKQEHCYGRAVRQHSG